MHLGHVFPAERGHGAQLARRALHPDLCVRRDLQIRVTVVLLDRSPHQYRISAVQRVQLRASRFLRAHRIDAEDRDGTSPTLWLDQIVHTGSALAAGDKSAKAITTPPIKFGATPQMANRLDTQADGLPAYFKYRLQSITTETGSNITVAYGLPNACSAAAKPTAATNTSSCYPVSWVPDSYTAPITDWFNKYAVVKVSQDDPTGGASAQVTSYEYQGGAAWHFDDNELVKAKYRSYGQFRGYGDVLTYLGDGTTDARAKSEVTYYRGMSKNNNAIAVPVTDSLGGTHEDLDQLAGNVLETSAYLGDTVDHSEITSYWVSDTAATRTRTGLPALTSNWVAPVETFDRQALTATGSTTWRYTETDTAYASRSHRRQLRPTGSGLPPHVARRLGLQHLCQHDLRAGEHGQEPGRAARRGRGARRRMRRIHRGYPAVGAQRGERADRARLGVAAGPGRLRHPHVLQRPELLDHVPADGAGQGRRDHGPSGDRLHRRRLRLADHGAGEVRRDRPEDRQLRRQRQQHPCGLHRQQSRPGDRSDRHQRAAAEGLDERPRTCSAA